MNQTQKANPAPIGLIGFGMTTILLNLHNAGFFGLGAAILAMGITIGGIAQIIAGILEFKNHNTFASVAFISYGFFWLSLVAVITLPNLGIAETASAKTMGSYLTLWGLFTLGMFVCTLKLSNISTLVFGSLFILFALLAIADFTGSATIKTIAGFEGIVCGMLAMYDAMGQIINEVHGKTILPL